MPAYQFVMPPYQLPKKNAEKIRVTRKTYNKVKNAGKNPAIKGDEGKKICTF
jgi:hypothetical protein